MSLVGRALNAARRANAPAWLAGMALAGTYAAAFALERRTRPSRGAANPEIEAETEVLTDTKTKPAPLQRQGWAFWKHVLYRTYVEIGEDRLLALAAGVVFYGLLAIFPAITALVSSYALFARPSTINAHLASIASMMPASAYAIVDEQVTRIVTRTTGGLSVAFFFGLGLALWSANAGVKAIIDALNIVYGVKDRRGFIWLNVVSLLFTAGAIVGMLLAISSVVVLPVVLSFLPFGGLLDTLLTWMRWPLLLLATMLGLAMLYRFGPDRDGARWQFISPGAILAGVSWLAGSAMLSWYLGNFANFDATYGSLGAGIGLMIWLWMTAIVVLVGAELNSEIDAASGVAADKGERLGG